MKTTLFRKLALLMLLFLSLGTTQSDAQTLSSGDIAMVGYCATNGTLAAQFSFVVLKSGGIPNGTQIVFTDNGWNTLASPAALGTAEGTITWTSTSALAQFTEVSITTNSTGTAVNSVSTGNTSISGTFLLSGSGDQVLAYQGSSSSPTFIAGIQMNKEVAFGTSTASDLPRWDSLSSGGWTYDNSTRSTIPPGLTTGVNAVMAVTGTAAPYTENRSARYACATSTSGASTPAALAAIINERNNWDRTTSAGAYTFPNNCTFSLGTPPSITGQPSNATTCVGSSTSFTVTASNATGYQWQVNTGTGFTNVVDGGVYSGATTATLSVTGATAGMNGYAYQVTVTGSSTPNAVSNSVTLTVNTTNTWSGGTSTAWSTATNWSCGSIPTASTDVLIPSGTSFSPQVDITSAICNNITINTGASLSFVAGSNVLEVKGNFTKNGTLVATAGKLKLSGTGAQTVPGATYKDFELAGSGTKTANGGINISGVLTLTNGFLQLGANDLTLGSAASVAGANAVLLNAAPTSYIITNSTGQMRIQNIGATGKTGAVLFPVGTSSSSYTPVTIQNAGTSDVFGVRVIDGVYRSYTAAGVPNGTLQSNYNVNKTWLITESTAGGSNATVNFAWALSDQQPSFDNGACFASHFTNGNWQTVFPGQPANGFDPYSLAMNNITSFSPFAIGSSGSILPLDLLSFTGKAAPNGAQLNWNTINEKNLAGFDVERSADGNTYERITTVAAKGNNSTMENSYTYTDATTPKGTSYYRLKINDYGTEFKYSNTVVISENGTKNYAYTVYPNPADGNDLNIRFSDVLTSGVDVTITDLTGRVWYKGNFEAGKSILPVNIKGIPAGIYQVHISSDMISGTTRFTKL